MPEEREPAALTAKFSGMRPPYPNIKPWVGISIEGPFRVVLIRDGGLYQSFMCPTGQPLVQRRMKLKAAQRKAEEFFTAKWEDWTECEKSKGLPV